MILGALQTHTTDTFLFISHKTNVLLFKFRCNIFIGVRIIKGMPGSVASGTPCSCPVIVILIRNVYCFAYRRVTVQAALWYVFCIQRTVSFFLKFLGLWPCRSRTVLIDYFQSIPGNIPEVWQPSRMVLVLRMTLALAGTHWKGVKLFGEYSWMQEW